MNDPCAEHQEGTSSEAVAGRLLRMLIVVPPRLPLRVSYLTGMLAASGINVIVDRRHAVRRRSSGVLADERRRQDRRGHDHLFGYLHGCSIVRVGQPAST